MSVEVEVELSGGQKVKVKRLGLFEIQDNLGLPDLEPYTVSVTLDNGKTYKQIYTLDYDRPKPDTPFEMCEKQSREYWNWIEYHNWQDGLAYLERQGNDYAVYCRKVATYIRDNAVIGDTTSATVEDWQLITHHALCHLVTQQDVDQQVENLGATYQGEPIKEAYKVVKKSGLSYDYRKVELDMMTDLREAEEVYFSRSVANRARLIASRQIDAMGSAIEHHAAIEAAKADGKAKV